jgi:hypothetical protein
MTLISSIGGGWDEERIEFYNLKNVYTAQSIQAICQSTGVDGYLGSDNRLAGV